MKKSSQKAIALTVIISVLTISSICGCEENQNTTDNNISSASTDISTSVTQDKDKVDENNSDEYYPVNSNGQTYGTFERMSDGVDAMPDLLATIGKNNVNGYIYKDDFLGKTQDNYEHYKEQVNDENILRWLRSEYKDFIKNKDNVVFYEEKYNIPVYANDGSTIVDNVCVCVGYSWE